MVQGERICPHCGGDDTHRRGFAETGKQVYLCKPCKKYFCDNPRYSERICEDCGVSFLGCRTHKCRDCSEKRRIAKYKIYNETHKKPHKPRSKCVNRTKRNKKNREDVMCPYCLDTDTRKHSKCKNIQGYYCKQCKKYFSENTVNRIHIISEVSGVFDNSIMCMVCGEFKQKKDFYLKEKKYVHNICKKCYKQQNYYFRKYGVTNEQYERSISEHNFSCAICSTPFAGNIKKCIDHNHATGEFRGVLCNNCNMLLGFCKDNVTILYSAINYLYKSEE